MKSVCYAITLLIIFGGKTLAQKAEMFYDHNIDVDMNNVPVDNNQYYFPLAFFPVTEIQYIQEDSGH